ncbi:hypothetical protein A5880_001169 [Enterococcus sp. 4G2_DIV0659]|uniref:Uncharacterized protein n=2 Tax=Candidatus Enterococcus mansonii TaxID=1834181 RepID=A0A242CCM3_9ENTE|nr:hypothetical protein A5880_002267 [Enterococcus sp. 4G2_DIV0659]
MIALITIYTVLLFTPNCSFAQEESARLITGLSYDVIYPKNQTDTSLGYFDMNVQSGQEQKVVLKLTNTLSENVTVKVQLNSAKTNSNGFVEYGPSTIKKDASLKYDLADIVKAPKKVIVPAKGSTEVELAISIPKPAFNGLISGGIQIKPVEQNEDSQQQEKDVVVNEFAFLVGMLLRVGETKNIEPKLELNKTYVAFKEGSSHLFVNISNTQPVYAEGMNFFIQVRKANRQKTLFEDELKEMRMAPNSMIDLPIELQDKEINAGEYTAQITASAKSGVSWSWTDNFTITSLEANRIKEQRKERTITSTSAFWYFGAGLVLLLSFASYLFVRRKKRRVNFFKNDKSKGV